MTSCMVQQEKHASWAKVQHRWGVQMSTNYSCRVRWRWFRFLKDTPCRHKNMAHGESICPRTFLMKPEHDLSRHELSDTQALDLSTPASSILLLQYRTMRYQVSSTVCVEGLVWCLWILSDLYMYMCKSWWLRKLHQSEPGTRRSTSQVYSTTLFYCSPSTFFLLVFILYSSSLTFVEWMMQIITFKVSFVGRSQ